MEVRRLGESGFKVPVLSFGTGTFGGGNEFFDALSGFVWASGQCRERRAFIVAQ